MSRSKDSSVPGSPSRDHSISIKSSRYTALLLFLGGLFVFGLGSLIYLLLLPSSSAGQFAGRYSLPRILLLGGAFAIIAITGFFIVRALRDKAWSSQFADAVFGNARNVYRLAIAVFGIAGALLIMGIAIGPAWLSSLNAFHIQRLAPYLLLPFVFLGLYWIGARIGSKGISISFSSLGIDIIIGAILFFLSVGIRFSVTGYALPYAGAWDEVVTYAPALSILRGDDEAYKPLSLYSSAGYGELLVHMTAAADVIGFIDGIRTQQVDSLADFVSPTPGVETIMEGVHPSGIPLRYPRILFALIGSLASPLVYLGLRRHLGADRGPAIVGSLLIALGISNVVVLSGFILPDPLAMTFALGIVLCGLEAMQDQNGYARWYALSGLLVGLACGVVLRYAILIALPLLALALAANRNRPFLKLGALGAGVLLGFVFSSPGFFTHTSRELSRLATNVWLHDASLTHRIESSLYYFESLADGAGIVVLFIALIGATSLLYYRTRAALFLLLFVGAYMWWLSPLQARHTRHVLVLYPIIALFAGSGVQAITSALESWGSQQGSDQSRNGDLDYRIRTGLSRSASWLIPLLLFIALLPQISAAINSASRMARYKTPQEKMAEFLDDALQAEDKVGILDLLPFSEAELVGRGIAYERIPIGAPISELQTRGIVMVVGTDRVFKEYGDISGSVWANEFSDSTSQIAVFGSQELEWRGRPKPDVFLFAVRIEPSGD